MAERPAGRPLAGKVKIGVIRSEVPDGALNDRIASVTTAAHGQHPLQLQQDAV
eukprot:CAMPEP_0115230924 /NCGR_PEP_ID=MMETSP0270-20121206/32966_1 /TAXON_ID=71861 /ORGANISM="Scrippsiella trochoidea, Strain CCMP3099" /LENGTH=52 /DNA_ID=CAMNT_0002645531 /DNA_START=188 /DNA_END=343 /DNA_ORIENTATION=-